MKPIYEEKRNIFVNWTCVDLKEKFSGVLKREQVAVANQNPAQKVQSASKQRILFLNLKHQSE
jgi:hypothetical protein